MSVTINVSNKVAKHLNNLALGENTDTDEKLRTLLEAEYRRKLTLYSLTDRQFIKKYGLKFEEFENQKQTKQHGYTWDVESDAIAWETSVDGIRTMTRQLMELVNKGPFDDN